MVPSTRGDWNITLYIDEAGLWIVNTSFKGNDIYMPSFESKQFIVEKFSTRLNLDAEAKEERIFVYGSIIPPLENVKIDISFISPNNSKFIVNTTTDAYRCFNYSFELDMLGEWEVLAAWFGNEYYSYSLNSTRIFLKFPVSIMISEIPKNIVENEEFEVRGYILPGLRNQNITVLLSSDSEVKKSLIVYTSENGEFAIRLVLTAGKWNITLLSPESQLYERSVYSIKILVKRRLSYNPFIIVVLVVLIACFLICCQYLKKKS